MPLQAARFNMMDPINKGRHLRMTGLSSGMRYASPPPLSHDTNLDWHHVRVDIHFRRILAEEDNHGPNMWLVPSACSLQWPLVLQWEVRLVAIAPPVRNPWLAG